MNEPQSPEQFETTEPQSSVWAFSGPPPALDLEALSAIPMPQSATAVAKTTGRSPGAELSWEIVRSLGEADLPAIRKVPEEISGASALSRITWAHHNLAQLLSAGLSNEEASVASGYGPSYISMLKSDPQFRQLLAHYAGQVEDRLGAVMDQLKVLGQSAVGELQGRLAEAPDAFSNRELLDIAESSIIKPMQIAAQAKAGAAPGAVLPVINVSFVNSPGPSPAGPVIEGTPNAAE